MGDLSVGTIWGRVELEDVFSTVLDKIQAKLEPFAASTKDFAGNLKEFVENPLKFAKESTLEVLDTLGPLGISIAAVGTVVGVLGAGMFELAEKSAEAGIGVLEFSRITGAAVEDVGALSAAAQIGGSSLEGLQGMLFQVQRRMDQTGQAADKFNHGLEDLKINAEEFRAAGPSDRIAMLSEGMRGAAGTATMMSDALAVMGRGAMTNLPLLMKNFDELREKGKEVAYTWSTEDVEASEKFQIALAEVKFAAQETTTSIGIQLLPAMTSILDIGSSIMEMGPHTAEAIAGIGTAGLVAFGVLSPVMAPIAGIALASVEAFKLLGHYLEDDAAQSIAYAAAQDPIDRMWAQAAKDGKNMSEAAYDIARSMLQAGYGAKFVAEQTGLADGEVNRVKSSLELASKAAIGQAEAWARVDEAFTGFSDIDLQIRGLVKDMFAAKVSIDDIAATTNLSKEQVKGLTEQFKEAAKAEKDYAKGWDDLNSLGKSYADVLDGVNPKTQQLIEYYVRLGAKVEDLVKAFPELTKTQVEAIDSVIKANAKAADTIAGLYETYYQKKWSLGATDLEKISINAEIEYEKRVKQLQDQGVTDVAYYNALWDLRQKDVSDNEDILNQQLLKRVEVSNSNASVTKKDVTVVETLAEAWSKVGKGIDETSIKIRGLDGELRTLKEEQDRFNMGGSFTYDLSSTEGIAQYKKMNPAATFQWSDDQIKAYIKKGGNLAGLITTGVINPYGGMGHFKDGGPVVGDQVAQVHDGEFVIPKGGALVSGSGGGNTTINVQVVGGTFTDPQSVQRAAKQLADASIERMRQQGWRPGQVKR